MNVYDLPIFKEHFQTYLQLLDELAELLHKQENKHKILIEKAYSHIIELFSQLNAGYNYWGTKGKLQLYNKVRICISQLQVEIFSLFELKLISQTYESTFEQSIRYMNGLIRKFEQPVIENEK